MPNEWIKRNGVEAIKTPDFTSDKIKFYFKFESDVAEHLPEITQEDYENKKERFGIFLGKVEWQGNEVKLIVKGIFENDPEDPRFYKEGVEEVYDIDYQAIEREIEYIKQLYPEYEDFNLLGEIHTHPKFPNEVHPNSPYSLSSGDIEGIKKLYEEGTLSKKTPFIFGVAGLDNRGNTQYAFYRVVRKENEYIFENIELQK